MLGNATVSVDSNKLLVQSGENVTYYVPIDSTVFRRETSSEVIAFDKHDGGMTMFLGGLPIVAFDKQTGWSNPAVQRNVFVLILILTIITLLFWPLAYVVRRGYRLQPGTSHELPRWMKVVAWINSLLLLLFVVQFIIGLGNPTDIVYGVTSTLKVALTVPLLMLVTTALMLFGALKSIRMVPYRLWSCIYYLIITLASITFLVQLNTWNLLGYHF